MKKQISIEGIVTAAAWGSSFIFLKQLTRFFTPFELTFLRYGLAGIFFWMISWNTGSRIKMTWKDGMRLFFFSGFGIALSSICAAFSMNWLTSSECGMMNSTIPAITLLVERIVFGMRMKMNQVVAVVVSILGVGLIGFSDLVLSFQPLGVGLMLLALVFWVTYGYGVQPLFDRYESRRLNTLQNCFAALFTMPFLWLIPYQSSMWSRMADFHVLFLLFGASILTSGLGYLFYLKGIRSIGVPKMAFYLNLQPIVTVMEGGLILRETLHATHIMGIALILLSVWMIQRNGKTPEKTAKMKSWSIGQKQKENHGRA